jgi:hypothetical protein
LSMAPVTSDPKERIKIAAFNGPDKLLISMFASNKNA